MMDGINNSWGMEVVTDVTLPDVIDDITSDIAWEVISKKGRAIFTTLDELKALGNIALKVRYKVVGRNHMVIVNI